MQFALVPCTDRFAQRPNASRRGVLRLVFVNRSNGCLLNMVWRREVWLAGAKVGHVDAFGFHLFGFGKDGSGWRDLDSVDAVGQLHLKLLRQWTSCSH